MPSADPVTVVQLFINAINAHTVAALCDLMTDDHEFVDSLGAIVRGREEMRKAWIGYFYMIPDFTITCTAIFQHENAVALFGHARGTYSSDGKLHDENRWKMPVAWRAIVRDGRVAQWHVYADNEPLRQIIAGQQTHSLENKKHV